MIEIREYLDSRHQRGVNVKAYPNTMVDVGLFYARVSVITVDFRNLFIFKKWPNQTLRMYSLLHKLIIVSTTLAKPLKIY